MNGELTLERLMQEMMNEFHHMLRSVIYENGLTEEEVRIRQEEKKKIRMALRNCAFGHKKYKCYVKELIKEILIQKFRIEEEDMEHFIPFSSQERLSAPDQFEILLYRFKQKYQADGLAQMIMKYHLDKEKQNEEGEERYEITAEEILEIYMSFGWGLSYLDKLEILTQRLYQLLRGNGVIDEIRDMNIDGVSAGVSGLPEEEEVETVLSAQTIQKSYESVWIFYQGKSIHLSFLSFCTYKELIRVCKNIYRYNNPGQLTQINGYIVNEMQDGSRVCVARPPFSESWVFFIRKFNFTLQKDIGQLLPDSRSELAVQLMKWLIKGCRMIAITGAQGSGKTTLLTSLISFISPRYNLRIQELSFELHLRKLYPKRNIVSFRETHSITGQEGLDFQKKTDGTVSILGEVASQPVAGWLVEMSMVASLFTLFTHHAKTSEGLVLSLRNSLLATGHFQNEEAALIQAVGAVEFDIHMTKDAQGHRYIARITEILPGSENSIVTRDILVYEGGEYKMVQELSDRNIGEIRAMLTAGEEKSFHEALALWREQVYGS